MSVMLVEHEGHRPHVDPSAYVAPSAEVCGQVRIGAEARILAGAVLTAETGPVDIGEASLVMEHAVVRGTRHHPVQIGRHVLIGPHAYLTGGRVADQVFLATGSAIFNGAVIEQRAEVRIHGVVHVRSRLPADATVPIGWIAVGDPAKVFAPSEHDSIWPIQRDLDFPGTVFGLPRAPAGGSIMPDVTRRYGRVLNRHRTDRPLAE